MIVRRTRVLVVAVAALIAVAATACSSEQKIATIGYSIDDVVTTYNAGSIAGSASAAPQAFTRVLPGFSYLGPDGGPLADTDIGTASLVAGDTQTIYYGLSPSAVWSDGTPMGCEDVVLAWAAHSGRFTSADGRPLFDAASTSGYADIDRIDCGNGSKDALVHFRADRAYRDWRTLFGATAMMPAHVAARVAGVSDVPAAIGSGDTDAIGRIAQAWNTAWTLVPGQFDPANFPSSGPYRIESYTVDGGLVLMANEKWWGRVPETPRIVLWPKGTDVTAKAAAGDVEVVDGDPSDASPTGFDATALPGWGLEQLILATSGVFANPSVRRAFGSCLPRTELYTDFGHPGYDASAGRGGGPLDSRLVAPGSLPYAAIALAVGSRYLQTDTAAATAQLVQANSPTITVRIGYLGPNDRRAAMVAAIAAACEPAGITVVDASSATFAPTSLGTDVDVVLAGTGGAAGTSGSALSVDARSALRTGQGLNLGNYSNSRIDQILDTLAVDDSDVTTLTLGTEAENTLWADVPTVPLFSSPRKVSVAPGMKNVVTNVTRAGSGWNMDRWVLLG